MRQLHLLYHEIRPAAAAYSYVTGAALFQRHVDFYRDLLASGAEIVPVITFDDGHVSNLEFAAPILASGGLTARFFITAGWTAARPGYMDWTQLRSLVDAGHSIGAHGWSHMFLTRCTSAQLDRELRQARLTLEDRLGVSITTMSLPGGRANRRVLAGCREAGYTHVYTSVPRLETAEPGVTIGRLNVRGNTETAKLAQLFDPSSSLLARLGRTHRLKSAARSILGDRLYAHLWAVVNRQEPEPEFDIQFDPASGEGPSHESAAYHQ